MYVYISLYICLCKGNLWLHSNARVVLLSYFSMIMFFCIIFAFILYCFHSQKSLDFVFFIVFFLKGNPICIYFMYICLCMQIVNDVNRAIHIFVDISCCFVLFLQSGDIIHMVYILYDLLFGFICLRIGWRLHFWRLHLCVGPSDQ